MSKVVIVGPHFELVYLASLLAEKHEVTLIDKYVELGGYCYDDQRPRYGLNPVSSVPEELAGLFVPVDISTAWDNYKTTVRLPITQWGLQSLGEDVPLNARPEFQSEGMNNYDLLVKRLGKEYSEEVVIPLVESIYGESVARISPVIIFDIVEKYLEFNPHTYLPSGGYTSVANMLLGMHNIKYETVLPPLEQLESDYDIILWGDSPRDVFEKYYFDLAEPMVRAMAPEMGACKGCGGDHSEDPMDAYRAHVDLNVVFHARSIQDVECNAAGVPMPAIRCINSSSAYEVINVNFLSLGSEIGCIGYTSSDEIGMPILPFRYGFDAMIPVVFPSKYRFVNRMSKMRIPNLDLDLATMKSEAEHVDRILTQG